MKKKLLLLLTCIFALAIFFNTYSKTILSQKSELSNVGSKPIKLPISQYAYVLSWDKASFISWYKKNKNSKIIFRFYYVDDHTAKELTVAGWSSTANDYFDDDPSINDPTNAHRDLEILNTNSSAYKLNLLDTSFFLGNIKLSQWMLYRIKKGLKSNKYLLLKPVLDVDSHVIYEIYLQMDDPHQNKAIAANATLIGKTDPSPPAPHQ